MDRAAAAGLLQCFAHHVHIGQRNALILPAVEAEHRGMEGVGDVHRVPGRQLGRRAIDAAIPGHAALELRVVRGIQPGDATAPAEAGDRERVRVATLARRPGGAGIEVGHHLGVRHPGDDVLEDLAHVGDRAWVALADANRLYLKYCPLNVITPCVLCEYQRVAYS